MQNRRDIAGWSGMITNELLEQFGYSEWSVSPTGVLVCPHGRLCEDDQRDGLAECGCISPLVRMGLI